MLFDGSEINVGDKLYYMLFDRPCEVVEIIDSTIVIQIDSSRFNFGRDGKSHNGVKALFWHKPAMNLPAKNGEEETAKMQVVINTVGSLYGK